ncbi:MAG: FHA domain-containing protein [Chthoniobacteraceae bacterium]
MSAPRLVIIRGLDAASFPLQVGQGIIGRAPGSAIELRHPEISRQHCRVAWDGQTCTVENISSTRGTTINGLAIATPVVLKPGEELGVGPVYLRIELDGPPVAEPAPPPLPANAPSLILVRGMPTDRIELRHGPLVIGRDSSCDVMLNEKSVSRKHATLQPQPGGGCLVRDENSQGGSFVNGRRFDEHEFTVGDRLEIGPFCFQFDGLALVSVTNTSGGSIRAQNVTMQVSERSLLATVLGKPRRDNVILDEISITIPPSRFFGLIGPSGAGKSSLLHTLAGLRKPERGVVLIDGEDIYAHDQPPSFGYVPQDDIVHGELTVRQALRFSARLRLSRETPRHELDRLIAQTLDQLILTPRAELPIWRLSGGQRKRVSVAVELLARPSILFLDEPSSGLDPATEFQLMTLLRDLADTGCTIVCTTHVMENAFLIDQLVILVSGVLAYQGSPAEVKDYFGVKKLTDLYDRLDERPPKQWQEAFAPIAAARPGDLLSGSGVPRPPQKVRRAFALPILLARQWTILRSDWRNFLILLGQPPIIAALVCWVVTDKMEQPRDLVMFFAYLSTLWFGTSNAARVIVEEIPIYRRERLIGVGGHAYLLSKFIFLSALTCVQSTLLYALMIWFEGGRDGAALLQLGGLCTTAIAAVGIGCAISAISRSVMHAVMSVPLILIPMIIFAGFVVRPGEMTDTVKAASRSTPGFAAQELMDTSFIYNRPWEEVRERLHRQSQTNLSRMVEEPRMEDERWMDLRPAREALAVHAAWALATYWLAWFALRRRERG